MIRKLGLLTTMLRCHGVIPPSTGSAQGRFVLVHLRHDLIQSEIRWAKCSTSSAMRSSLRFLRRRRAASSRVVCGWSGTVKLLTDISGHKIVADTYAIVPMDKSLESSPLAQPGLPLRAISAGRLAARLRLKFLMDVHAKRAEPRETHSI